MSTSIEWTDETWNPAAPEWRAVPGYEGYFVTAAGRMRGPRGPMRPMAAHRGHLYILTVRPGVPRKLYVHKAVLLAFVGPPPPGHEARHLNDVPHDNRIENLAWGTPLENAADKIRNGGQTFGERSGTAKLTELDVRSIRLRYAAGGVTLRALGAEFGVSHTAIRRAVTGTKWGHVR